MATIVEGPTKSRLVRSFGELGREDVSFAGGKGANLGELTRAGFPVPSGFVVGAPAYADVRRRTAACATGSPSDSPASTWTTQTRSGARPTRFARWSAAAPIPESVERRASAGLRRACGDEPAVAVRSSATAEDTEAASFAGMNETFLNIRGADAVVDAVRRCWASLFGARTIFYRAKRGFGQADMDIAVVVQRQVDVDRAGRDVHDRSVHGRDRPRRDRGRVRARRSRRQRPGVARPLRRRQGDPGDPSARDPRQDARRSRRGTRAGPSSARSTPRRRRSRR